MAKIVDICERNLYLKNEDLEDAVSKYLKGVDEKSKGAKSLTIKVVESLNGVTTGPIFAQLSSPFYNASAMDGICVKALEITGVDERNPKILKLNQDFKFVDTGDVIEDPYNAVVMIEDVVSIDETHVRIASSVSLWQHVRPIGEDIVAGELIVPAYHKIRAMDIGALLAGGILELEVFEKPKIGIIPTGTELIEAGETMAPGKIIDSNTRMFEALVLEYGGMPTRYTPVPDDYEIIKSAILKATAENDIVLISAGSSAGTEDYTRALVEELGEVAIHGVAIKPGKPAILGFVKDKPVIGIPGYPVSAYFVLENFVKPLVLNRQKQGVHKRPTIKAILSKRLMSTLKYEEFVRMKCGKVKGRFVATPLDRGAGVTMSLVNADGILRVPKNVEGYETGQEVLIELLRPIEEIENTLVTIGSHDVMIDIMANIIHKNKKPMNLSSAHVGSLGGIMSFKKGECHLSPTHLLDEATGEYNIAVIKKYIGIGKVALIKGVKRVQGFMIPKGNPKNIKGIEDLKRKDITFVNRQRGAGTRVLFDYLLKQKNMDPLEIVGYTREMNTHMMVASAVQSGSCDVGMGVLSAANMMALDFIPVGHEDYDFIVAKEDLDDEKVQLFLSALKSQELREALEALGGYHFDKPGSVVLV